MAVFEMSRLTSVKHECLSVAIGEVEFEIQSSQAAETCAKPNSDAITCKRLPDFTCTLNKHGFPKYRRLRSLHSYIQ